MKLRQHADKIAYFFIAFAIYLLIRSIFQRGLSPLTSLLYVSIAISLLSSNVPRVMDLPMHFAHPLRRVEYVSFIVSVSCFLLLCLKHML